MNFNNVAHLYVGCDIDISQTEYGKMEMENGRLKTCYLAGIRENGSNGKLLMMQTNLTQHSNGELWLLIDMVKPILRPLSLITVEELCEIYKIVNKNWVHHDPTSFGYYAKVYVFQGPKSLVPKEAFKPEVMAFLLSKGFDLFGLIESGEAIDKSTITKKQTA